jgi:hypothetical protein
MVSEGQTIEVTDTRTLTTKADGVVSGVWISPNGRRLAYVANGRAVAAELTVRPPTSWEKAGAGLQVSEQEMLLDDIKQIGLAAMMYAQDNDGNLPGMDSAMQDMSPYVMDSDVFNSPGTSNGIFKLCASGNQSSMSDPAGTIMGIMDAGYKWQAIVYGDGHARIMPK